MGVVMSRLRAAQSYTRYPNTPETDAMPKVEHVVHVVGDGEQFKVSLWATDPMTAIERINRMDEASIRSLPRITE